MAQYRIFLLDAVGRIVSRGDHDCADDHAATDLALTLLPQQAQAEVWLGARCVGLVWAGEGRMISRQ